jgi:hypothetical protein
LSSRGEPMVAPRRRAARLWFASHICTSHRSLSLSLCVSCFLAPSSPSHGFAEVVAVFGRGSVTLTRSHALSSSSCAWCRSRSRCLPRSLQQAWQRQTTGHWLNSVRPARLVETQLRGSLRIFPSRRLCWRWFSASRESKEAFMF